MTRKERSEAYLKEHGVRINPHLPDIDTKGVKSAEEILRRAVAAFLASQIAADLAAGNDVQESARFFTGLLVRFGLQNDLTTAEQRLFAYYDPEAPHTVSKEEAADLSWRMEMCMPLFWACGLLTDELPYPDRPSDIGALVRVISAAEDFDVLRILAKPRSEEEILDRADLLFRMDWACVDAQLKQEKPGGWLYYDVVMEQHKGLNWIIGAVDAEDWDNVKPHT